MSFLSGRFFIQKKSEGGEGCINIPKLDTILRKGRKWSGFNFSDVIERGKKELAKMVIDEINEKWSQDQKYGFDKMFLIGSGGEYLFEEIKNSRELGFIKDRIELPADFRFINAKGCLVKAHEIEDIVLNQNISFL